MSLRITEVGSTMLSLGTEFLEGEFGVSIPELFANSRETFSMIVKVRSNATPYKVTLLDVYLNLSPPGAPKPVPIQRFELPVQISNHYKYNPKANVLLVTNSCTSSQQVDAWQNLVSGMGMSIDVYNVSLYGHMGLKDSILSKYLGKMVVLLGNNFGYFE